MRSLTSDQGYGTVKTNLYTVAPYCVGCVILLAQCASSDHFRERSIHLAGSMLLTLIGYILLITLDTEKQQAASYFACFLLTAGAFTPSCIFHSWHNNNTPSENGRAAVTGFMVGASNSGGIISSLAFQSKMAPKYIPALIVTAVFQAVGLVMALGFGMWFRWDNRRRDKLQGVRLRPKDISTSSLRDGVSDPAWRWTA